MLRCLPILTIASLCFLLPQSQGLGEIQKPLSNFDNHALELSLLAFVKDHISIPFDSISVCLDSPDLKIDNQSVIDIRFERVNEKPLLGTCPIRLLISLNDGKRICEMLTARVKLYRKVAVASWRLSAKKVISPDDIRIEMRQIISTADRPITSYEEVAGQRTRRAISSGKVLFASDFEPIPVIERGSSVMLAVVVGAVTVTSKAVALEDGWIGEKICVQDLTTRRRVTGTVVGKGLVILERPTL